MRLDEALAYIEIDREQRMIGQHQALRLLEQGAAPGGVGLDDSLGEQGVIPRVRVPSEIDAEVALQQLREGVGIVEIADPAGAEDLGLGARLDRGQQRAKLLRI